MDKRILFKKDPTGFFEATRTAAGLSWPLLAKQAGISSRTLRSWRSQESMPPAELIYAWSKIYELPIPSYRVISLNEKRKQAASLGGQIRQELYGDVGTLEGRRLGGIRAQKTHRKNPLSPFTARHVPKPQKSVALAELFGAILGDGTITKYQLILFSNLRDEREYADFLACLVEKLFENKPSSFVDANFNVIKITSSRKKIIAHLQSLGLCLGNKTKQQVGVPYWITRSREYSRACLRGLIDTDGCVYIDHHKVKGRKYGSVCIAFTNASIPLLDFVETFLQKEGFNPTRWGRHVRIRRRSEVLRYAKDIGFSNPKHSKKLGVY